MKLYTQETCPKCKVLKKMLDTRGLEYNESMDINELIKRGFKATPVLETGDGEFLDFTEAVKYIKRIG